MNKKYNIFLSVLKSTFKPSIKVSWMLIKIYIPLSIFTAFLKQLGFFEWISPFLSPFMKYLGLPGEASLALIAGFFNNIFAALAVMSAIDLDFRQITILGIIIGIAHNLIIETGVLIKLKFSTWKIGLFRIFFGLLAGYIFNLIIPEKVSGVVLNPFVTSEEFSWLIFIKSIFFNSIQILVFIFSIMLLYEILKKWSKVAMLKEKLKFLTNTFGMSTSAFAPWIVGFFIGIAYAAGILFQIVEKKEMNHKDTCLVTVFLVLAHAMIEDTMLFVVVGGNFWWIFFVRLLMAIIIVKILSIKDLYKKFLWIGLTKK